MDNWVDLNADAVWPRDHLQNRARNELARDFPDAAELQVRVGQLADGTGFLSASEQARWDAFKAARADLVQKVEDEAARSQLVAACLDVEAALRTLRDFPSLDAEDGNHDQREALRAAAQATVDTAPAGVSAQVATRNRVPAPVAEEPAA